jgi:hypothetical protein
LSRRHATRLAAAQDNGLVVRELPQIDHALRHAWARDIAASAIAAAVGTSDRTAA